jgi:hypothetical protein
MYLVSPFDTMMGLLNLLLYLFITNKPYYLINFFVLVSEHPNLLFVREGMNKEAVSWSFLLGRLYLMNGII